MNGINLENICAWKKPAETSLANDKADVNCYKTCDSCDGTKECGASLECQNYYFIPLNRN